MSTKLRAILISFTCAFLAHSAFAIQSAPTQSNEEERLERITVYGDKSIRELNKEIQKITKSFFKDYNKLNDNNEYVVVCKKQSQPNTNIKSQNCEPRYVKTYRGQAIATRIFSNNTAYLGEAEGVVAMARLINLVGVNKAPPYQNKKFQKHLAQLMKDNPHLIEKYQQLRELQDEYAYKKANR